MEKKTNIIARFSVSISVGKKPSCVGGNAFQKKRIAGTNSFLFFTEKDLNRFVLKQKNDKIISIFEEHQ